MSRFFHILLSLLLAPIGLIGMHPSIIARSVNQGLFRNTRSVLCGIIPSIPPVKDELKTSSGKDNGKDNVAEQKNPKLEDVKTPNGAAIELGVISNPDTLTQNREKDAESRAQEVNFIKLGLEALTQGVKSGQSKVKSLATVTAEWIRFTAESAKVRLHIIKSGLQKAQAEETAKASEGLSEKTSYASQALSKDKQFVTSSKGLAGAAAVIGTAIAYIYYNSRMSTPASTPMAVPVVKPNDKVASVSQSKFTLKNAGIASAALGLIAAASYGICKKLSKPTFEDLAKKYIYETSEESAEVIIESFCEALVFYGYTSEEDRQKAMELFIATGLIKE